VPGILGTSEAGGYGIINNGFGVVATTDYGYYGRGIYFTDKMDYAAQYAKKKREFGKIFVISLVTLGNPFPVTEHPNSAGGLNGKPCRKGYQSHFTVVDKTKISTAFPVEGEINQTQTAMEYVAFEGSQALPLFLIYYQDDRSLSPPSPSPSSSPSLSEIVDSAAPRSRFCMHSLSFFLSFFKLVNLFEEHDSNIYPVNRLFSWR